MNKPLRAIVEILNGEIIILPVADSDADAEQIFNALRIYFGQTAGTKAALELAKRPGE
jgi:hypothetical protein